MTRRVRIGDAASIRDGGIISPAMIVDFKMGAWLLALDNSGGRWLEVVMEGAATGYSRLAQLEPDAGSYDHAAIDRIAAALAWDPKRLDVEAIAGVARLTAPGGAIEWTPPAE